LGCLALATDVRQTLRMGTDPFVIENLATGFTPATTIGDRLPVGESSNVSEERAVGHNHWRPLFCAPQGLRNSAQGFNPGNRPPRATRPEGGARSNVLSRRSGARWSNCSRSQLRTLTFRRPSGASFIWYPHLLPYEGEPFLLRVPRVETWLKPWAEFCSPCGAGPRSIYRAYPGFKVETVKL
jgi:hypothetical protein